MPFIKNVNFAGRQHGIGYRVVEVGEDGRFEVSDEEYAELIGVQGYLPDDVQVVEVVEVSEDNQSEVPEEVVEGSINRLNRVGEGPGRRRKGMRKNDGCSSDRNRFGRMGVDDCILVRIYSPRDVDTLSF